MTTPTSPATGPTATGPTATGPTATGPTAGAVPPGPAGVPVLPAADPLAQAGAGQSGPSLTIGTYADYALAQQAVDYLSDNKFPVERTAIIGTDLRLVENVLGRMTTLRAAGAGAASGAWFGLFIGLFFGIFGNANWYGVIFLGLLIGAIWGAVFGAIAQAMTGGRRDFTSRSSLQAAQYAVITDAEVADEGRALLTRLNWNNSGAS